MIDQKKQVGGHIILLVPYLYDGLYELMTLKMNELFIPGEGFTW